MASELRRVCVFCASSPGTDPAITEATVALGRLLAEREIELVYGGGAVGLMGLVADTVIEAGGTVTGVIPTGLFSKEVAHRGLTTLEEVDTMHEPRTVEHVDEVVGRDVAGRSRCEWASPDATH